MDWEEYNNWFKQHYQREIKDFVSFIIHELKIDYTARILDIGSGPGWFSLELASRMPETEIISLEQNAELVTIANQNKIDTKITNINFVKHAPDELHTLSNRSLDCVTSFKVLKQWSFPQPVFNEIARVLKKDGKYAVIDYRNDLKMLAKASIWFTSRAMPPDFSSYWKKEISKSFSLEEIVKILLQTKLKDWKIRTTLFDYFIYKV